MVLDFLLSIQSGTTQIVKKNKNFMRFFSSSIDLIFFGNNGLNSPRHFTIRFT